MVIQGPFDLWSQNDRPFFVPIETLREIGTNTPDITGAYVNRGEDIDRAETTAVSAR